MIHNVLVRQLPGLARERLDAALGACADRPGTAAPDPLGRRVAGAAGCALAAAVTRRDVPAAWAEAPAKINLGLVVTGRRADGYHTLDSVFLRLALHDHLEARPAADPDGPDQVIVTGDPSVPTRENIVLRAVAALRQAAGIPLPALQLRLDKHIPAAAGLGGGSSDAAASLRLAAEVWGLAAATPPTDLLARLGADVPFFASGQAAARGRGIGEVAGRAAGTRAARRHPPCHTSRPTVDGRRLRGTPGLPRREPLTTTTSGTAWPTSTSSSGRCEPASVALSWRPWPHASGTPMTSGNRPLGSSPTLPALREALEAHLGRAVLLSGSGPTLVALYPSPEAAAEAATSLEAAGTAELGTATIIATSTSKGGTA